MKRPTILILFIGLTYVQAFVNSKESKKSSESRETMFYSRIKISSKYMQGPYLLYDCKDHHYACVDKASYNDCRARRKDAILNGKEISLNCAPLKKFNSSPVCIKNIYNLQSRVRHLEVCSNGKNNIIN